MLYLEIDIDFLLLWGIAALFFVTSFYMFWDVHYFFRMFLTMWFAKLFQHRLKIDETGVIYGEHYYLNMLIPNSLSCLHTISSRCVHSERPRALVRSNGRCQVCEGAGLCAAKFLRAHGSQAHHLQEAQRHRAAVRQLRALWPSHTRLHFLQGHYQGEARCLFTPPPTLQKTCRCYDICYYDM